jgi:hypothetical protein
MEQGFARQAAPPVEFGYVSPDTDGAAAIGQALKAV